MHLVLALTPSAVEFTEPLSGGAFPYLIEVGTLRMAARAGYLSGLGIGESPSLVVALDNASNRVADIIDRPLRAAATVYDDDGAEFFDGAVSAITYGRTIELVIEA